MTDYTDLIARLRRACYLAFDDGTNDYVSAPEAAAAIEDLQAEVARLRGAYRIVTPPDLTRPVIAAIAFKRPLTEAEQAAVGELMLRGQYDEAAAQFDGYAVYRKE